MTRKTSRNSDKKTVEEKLTKKQRVRAWWKENKIWFHLALLFFLFLAAFFYNNIFITIDAGEAGVHWKRLGGTKLEKTYGEGLKVIWPWDKMYIYEVRLQKIERDLLVLSSNGLLLQMKFSARFRPQKTRLPHLHQMLGPEYPERFLLPEVISALRTVIGNFTPAQIYAQDEAGLLAEISEFAKGRIHSKDIILEDILIHELLLPEMLQTAINEKLTHEQMAQAYVHRLESQRQELTRRTIEAESIKAFEEISNISILTWRGLEATEKLAESPSSKFIIMSTDSKSLPVILNADANK